MLHGHYFSSFNFISLFSWSLSKFGKRKRKLFALTPSNYIVCVYTTKLTRAVGALKRVRQFVPPSTLLTMYNSFNQPYFDSRSVVWEGLGFELALNSNLQKLQNRASGIITFSIVMILAPAPCCKSCMGWAIRFSYRGAGIWNKLPEDLRERKSMNLFKSKIYLSLPSIFDSLI